MAVLIFFSTSAVTYFISTNFFAATEYRLKVYCLVVFKVLGFF